MGVTQRIGIHACVHKQAPAKEGQLLTAGIIIRYLTEGVVDGKRRARHYVFIVYVGGNAHDAAGASRRLLLVCRTFFGVLTHVPSP
jgi:hypothetical protein